MGDNNWYYASNGQQRGPIDRSTLQSMARSGQLSAHDLVWTDGMANWIAAGGVEELFPTGGGVAAATMIDPRTGAVHPAPAGPIPTNYYQPPRQTYAQYAGFWLRFVAWFIDAIISGIAGAIVGGIVGFIIGLSMASSGSSTQQIEAIAGVMGQLLGIVIGWLYCAIMESSSTQATLGKMALGLRVTDMEGNRISFGRASGRHFAKILSGLILLIGYFMAGWTERKQGLHDMIANTLVLRK